jgi:hypothetical protein
MKGRKVFDSLSRTNWALGGLLVTKQYGVENYEILKKK